MAVEAAIETPARACTECGAPIGLGDRFCEACGHEQPAAVEATATGPRAAACAACGTPDAFVDGWCTTCGRKEPAPRDHIEIDLGGVAGVTDKGVRHHRNEDAMGFVVLEGRTVVAVVSDGVSTTIRPDDASQGAVDAAVAVLATTGDAAPDHLAAYDAARAAVLAVDFDAGSAPDLGPPSCTYLAAHVTDARISIAHLGDCRAYWRDSSGRVVQLTIDDSWATEQVAAGRMAADEAYRDVRAHSITAWLGRDADPAWAPAIVELDPSPGGRLLLVSDGLWNYTPSVDDLVRLLDAGDPAPLATAQRLVDHANGEGGADNITVVVVDVPLLKGPMPA